MPPDVAALGDIQCETEAPPEDETQANQDAPASAPSAAIIEPKPTPAPPTYLPPTPPDLAQLWSKVIRAEGISPLLRAVLINSSLTSFHAGKATIACLPRYATDANKRWRLPIAELFAKESASTTPIEVIIDAPEGALAPATPSPSQPVTQSPVQPAPQASSAAPAQLLTNPSTHPLVQTAIELFGGRIVDIQPRKKT